MHLSYLANFFFYNYKLSPRILRQNRVFRNLKRNKDIVITKFDKENGVVILDQKFYNNAIASSRDSFNHNLARFLCGFLSPFVHIDYSCKDTFSSFLQIKNTSLSKNFLVSFDVTSLFTNIPLQETIDIGIDLIFNHNRNLNITAKELENIFLFATSETHFVFNSKFYNQIDEVATGSLLAPALANIFMGFHESKWLNEYNLSKLEFYVR